MEKWKDISGYEQKYQVSDYGNVRSLDYLHTNTTKNLKTVMTTRGYMVVCLHKNGRQRNHYVHRLVAEAFCDNKNGYNEINHKDENKQNNHATNLEWCTRKENVNWGTWKERSAKGHSKPVVQLDAETGNVIATFDSITKAAHSLNVNKANIVSCCKHKLNTCGGYGWRYE